MAQAPDYQANQGSPDALPKGAATDLNQQVDQIDLNIEPPVEFPEPELDDSVPPMEGDLTGGLDNLVFGPTDRPHEPITQGAPVGEGSNSVGDARSAKERMQDTALKIINNPDVSPTTSAIMAKILRGE